MNKGIVHIVLIVLAVLAAIYGTYVGMGTQHNVAEGSFYWLMAIGLGGATKVLW